MGYCKTFTVFSCYFCCYKKKQKKICDAFAFFQFLSSFIIHLAVNKLKNCEGDCVLNSFFFFFLISPQSYGLWVVEYA